MHFSFKGIFFKFPSFHMTILTLTNGVTFHCICLVLQGYSGGALAVGESDGVWTQVGVVLFGSSAECTREIPVGFTRVTSFLNWISSATGLSFG
jgi:hypothetical protein